MLAASALGTDKMAFNFIILDLYGFVNLEQYFTLDTVVNILKLSFLKNTTLYHELYHRDYSLYYKTTKR